MTRTSGAAGRPRLDEGTDSLDRILLGVCLAVWLAALGAGVAAAVALVDLGRGHPQAAAATESADTPWLLYAVICVSAIVIAGAIPLLLRARSMNDTGGARSPAAQGRAPEPTRGGSPAVPRARAVADGPQLSRRPGYVAPTVIRPSAPTPGAAAVDQLWLRCSVLLLTAIGVGTAAIGVATYLMAVDSDTVSWVLYGVAGLITVAMPVIPVFYLRALRDLVDGNTV